MLNQKSFQLTTTEREHLIVAARASVLAHNAPHAIFFDSSGTVHVEQWRGQSYGGGIVVVVLPAGIEVTT